MQVTKITKTIATLNGYLSMTHIRIIAIALLTAFVAACGGGGGGSASSPVAPADFSGTWSGSSSGTAFVFSIVQTGSSFNMTRTTPVLAGLTYTGAVTGNSAAVTTYINNAQLATSTLTLLNNTTATMTVVTCTPPQGYTCGPPGLAITLTKAPIASTTSFPLQSGFKALVASGYSKNFTVSGTCTGSGNKSSSPATTPATFEGVAGLSATATFTMSLTNCTPASTAQSSTAYFTSNYVPLGFNNIGVNYAVYLTPPTIPTTVTVGATGAYGTQTLYTNSTKATGNGTAVQSYVIEADTSSTAIVNLIAKVYNASGTLTLTEQDRYRIDAAGTLTPTSIDSQSSNGSTTHLVLTF